MSAQVENYWKVHQGSVIACKCGRAHKKERRPRSSTCKECLAAENERRILFQIQETKRVVLKLIGLKQCPKCHSCKPFSEYINRKKALGSCNDCKNALRREKWANDDEYRNSRIERNKVYQRTGKHKDYRKKYNTINAKDIALKKAIGTSTPVHIKNCAVCGKYEVTKGNCISSLCKGCRRTIENRNRHRGRSIIASNTLNEIKCQQCMKNIYVFYGDKKRMCHDCIVSNARASKQCAKYRRKSKAKQGDRYNPFDVFNRDKWKCYICGIKTHKQDVNSDSYAQIDHVIPLSKGGTDILSNVKCCCRKCNMKKSDSLDNVQLNMFININTTA